MTDPARFEAFVREFQDMVFATAVRLLGNATEAEDVSQTVFLRAFQRFSEIGDSPTAAGWLKTVTTNLCLNHLSRYRARWQLFSEIDLLEPVSVAESDQFEQRQIDADRHERLELAMRRLPDHQRVPLVLFHFEERSYQDIATILGVSLGKVKTDIHRGRERLKRALT